MDDLNHYNGKPSRARVEEQKRTSSPPSGGNVSSFPPTSGTLQDTYSAYLKRGFDGEPAQPHKERSRSHSRSASSLSNLLLVTTERLGQETNRANALDTRCTEMLQHMRTIVEERDSLRRSLTKVHEELSLYKLQLDVAQNEIYRAQKIVDGVDKARVEAEEQAAKDRTFARKLVSERAVWVAREEGRNEGFKEGLREGRRWALAQGRGDRYTDGRYDQNEGIEYSEESDPSVRSSPSGSGSQRAWSSPARSVHSALPDLASYAPTIPMYTINPSNGRSPPHPPQQPTAPSNDRSPPHPPQQPTAPSNNRSPPHPPQQPTLQHPPRPERIRSPQSSRPLPETPARSPEPIDIRSDRHTIPRARSSSIRSRRSTTVPPDGFIPTLGADSVISLPAPYELSRPVSMVGDETPRTPGAEGSTRARGRTMSNVSRVSTRMSQFDILSPLKPSETPVTQSAQVVREWRAANTPEPPTARLQDANFSPRSSGAHSQASRQTGPRQPRDIVMPMPLSSAMQAQPPPRPHTSMSTSSGSRASGQQPTQAARPGLYAPPPVASNAGQASTSHVPMPPQQTQSPQENPEESTPTRPRSAIAWIKTRFNRSFSATSVPNIEVEPPSNSASHPSTGTTLNRGLLTPEDAEHQPLPQDLLPELTGAFAGVQTVPSSQPDTGSVIVLPDNHLPPGFVPLSPIMPNLAPLASGSGSAPAVAPGSAPFAVDPPRAAPPPAYTPRDAYFAPIHPVPASSIRMMHVRNPGSDSPGRARGASIGSAMLQGPLSPLNFPMSV